MMSVRDVLCNLDSSMQQLEQHERLRDEEAQILAPPRSAHRGGGQRPPHGIYVFYQTKEGDRDTALQSKHKAVPRRVSGGYPYCIVCNGASALATIAPGYLH